MPYRHIVDEAGDKLRILDIDGFYAPTFDLSNHEAEVRSIPDWKCRPDDVYICAYPKAGIYDMHTAASCISFVNGDHSHEHLNDILYNNLESKTFHIAIY